MRASRNGSPPRVADAARILAPGEAAREAALVAVDLRHALTEIRHADDGRARLLSEVREHAAALSALTSYVRMFERTP